MTTSSSGGARTPGAVVHERDLRGFALAPPPLAGGLGLLVAVALGALTVATADPPPLVGAALGAALAGLAAVRAACFALPGRTSLTVPSAQRLAAYVLAALAAAALAAWRAGAVHLADATHRPLAAAGALLLALLVAGATHGLQRRLRAPLLDAFFDPDPSAYARWWPVYLAAPAGVALGLLGVHRIARPGEWLEERWADRYVTAAAPARERLRRALPPEAPDALVTALAARLQAPSTPPDVLKELVGPPWPDERAPAPFEARVTARFFATAWPAEEQARAIGATPPAEAARVGRIFAEVARLAAQAHVRRWAAAREPCAQRPSRETDQAQAWFVAVACAPDRAEALRRQAAWVRDWFAADQGRWRLTRGEGHAVCALSSRAATRRRLALPGPYESDTEAADQAAFGELPTRARAARCDGNAGSALHLWLPGAAGAPAMWVGAIARARRTSNLAPGARPIELVQVWSNAASPLGPLDGHTAVPLSTASLARRGAAGLVGGCPVPASVRLASGSDGYLATEDTCR